MTTVSYRNPAVPRRLEVGRSELTLSGQTFRNLKLRGCEYGRSLDEDAPTAVIIGGITGGPCVFGGDWCVGPQGDNKGWWPALRRDGLIDLEQCTVLCPALPGWGSDWQTPEGRLRLSPADFATIVWAWLDEIGLKRSFGMIGASVGGLIGLAMALQRPQQVTTLLSISAGLCAEGWSTGLRSVQRRIVRDGLESGRIHQAMSLARALGMLSYRSREEVNARFSLLGPTESEPEITGYLQHHGTKFAERFPPETFLLLSETIDRRFLPEDPVQRRAMLCRLRETSVEIVGVPSDLLFPLDHQRAFHRELTDAGVCTRLHVLDSQFGHDAFLADQDMLAELLVQKCAFNLT